MPEDGVQATGYMTPGALIELDMQGFLEDA